MMETVIAQQIIMGTSCQIRLNLTCCFRHERLDREWWISKEIWQVKEFKCLSPTAPRLQSKGSFPDELKAPGVEF